MTLTLTLERETAPAHPPVVFPLSAEVLAIIDLALAEDVGRGDVTTEATVLPGAAARAEIVQKGPGVVCGLPVVERVFERLDPRVRVTSLVADGAWGKGERQVVARIEGAAGPILSAERTALNFLQRLSGVATAARRATQLVAGTRTTVLDTRKTTPGMRALEKYAVRVGGAKNHRAGLDDGILIKENHVRAAGGIAAAVARAQHRAAPGQLVEVEVTSLAELDEALACRADFVLLDNFSVDLMRQAVQRVDGRLRLEASGGVSLANLREVAETGVDYVSLGALTHSAGTVDFSLLFETERVD